MTVRLCGAKKKQGEGTCGRPAGWGTDHAGWGRCKLHGGSSADGKKGALRLAAQDAVVTYGLAREIDPHSALLEELHRTAGHVAWLEGMVQGLREDDLYGPVGQAGENFYPKNEPHVWVALYHEERKHYTAVAKTCIAVGIEERRVRLAEAQGQALANVIRGVLTELGVMDRPEVPEVVRRHLSVVADQAG